MNFPKSPGPIGVFDSGYGGLTVLHGIRQLLPQYDYMYLGDNARAPYGSRSFEVVYQFTRQAVLKLFAMGCHLVILGCNTASAKALPQIIDSLINDGYELVTVSSLLPGGGYEILHDGAAKPLSEQTQQEKNSRQTQVD